MGFSQLTSFLKHSKDNRKVPLGMLGNKGKSPKPDLFMVTDHNTVVMVIKPEKPVPQKNNSHTGEVMDVADQVTWTNQNKSFLRVFFKCSEIFLEKFAPSRS